MIHRLRYALGTLLVRVALWLMQPTPVRTGGPSVHDLVLADLAGRPPWLRQAIRDRRALGLAKYGTVLQAHNGRDARLDAEQEALDLLVYLRQAVEEARGPGVRRRTLRAYRAAVALAGDVRRLRGGR